jgi:predicted RNA-binding Zn-ribbon protein involved in translation (DUF1610 family)
LETATGSDVQSYTCPNCGATTAFAPGTTSLRCPFCGTELSVRASAAAAGTYTGALVLPFKLDKDASATRIREWLGDGFFSPGDLKHRSAIEHGQGTYVPFWRLDADAHSEWEGEISETRTRRVQRAVRDPDGSTRQAMVDEPFKVWHPRSGTHDGRHRTWVTGSSGLTQSEADQLMPFPEQALMTYSPDLLAGFAAEEPGVDERGAWVAGEPRIRELESEQCARQVEKITRVQTELSNKEAVLCFMPVWLYTYHYQGKPFRVLVNGHTGEILGDRPTSRTKVVAAVAAAAIVCIIVILLIALT